MELTRKGLGGGVWWWETLAGARVSRHQRERGQPRHTQQQQSRRKRARAEMAGTRM